MDTDTLQGNEQREALETLVKDAAIDLLNHMGASSITLPLYGMYPVPMEIVIQQVRVP